MNFVAPASGMKAFTCPHCGVLARQYQWGYASHAPSGAYDELNIAHAHVRLARCEACNGTCLWWKDSLVYPARGGAPPPNADMPADVRADYEEAARIHTASPRGAAALLRLAVQKLMVHLGQSGANINDDIAALVKRGLPVTIQRALDIVRVTGNNAVHPGQISTDDPSVAAQLFPLVNVIVQSQIAVPKRIEELYGSLPEGTRQAIEKRDAK